MDIYHQGSTQITLNSVIESQTMQGGSAAPISIFGSGKACRNFVTGTCSFGKTCRFSHDRPVCTNFARGKCSFGETCRYLHDNDQVSSVPRLQPNSASSALASAIENSRRSLTHEILNFTLTRMDLKCPWGVTLGYDKNTR